MKPYTLLNEGEIQQLTAPYGIGPVTQFQPLLGGLENSNYLLVTPSGHYVLTICERKTVEETEGLARLLLHLEAHGFHTTHIIPTQAGNSFSTYKGKTLLLKSYLDGQVIEGLPEGMIKKLGRALGKLHQIPAPSYLPKSFSYGIQTFGQLQAADVEHPFVEWLDQKRQYIQGYLQPELPHSLIHGDLFDNNVVIQHGGLPVIMDFEEACEYYRIYDIGMAVIGLCNRMGKSLSPRFTNYSKDIKKS